MTNPLLQPSMATNDVDYSAVTSEHFKEAFETLMPQVKAAHEASVTLQNPTYEQLVEADLASRQLSNAIGLLNHLTSVADTPELRAVYAEYMPRISVFYQELQLDERGYYQLKAYKDSEAFAALPVIKAKVITDGIRDYERGGILLEAAKKTRLAEIGARLAELQQSFSNNLSDFTSEAVLSFTKEELAGVPDRTLQNATPLENDKYEISKVAGGFADIMTYCEVADTRKAVYEYDLAYGVADGKDNRPVLAEIVALKQERAGLLGYASHAHAQLEDNMAATPEKALAFSRDLAARSHAKAKEDAEALTAYGTQLLGHVPDYHDYSFIVEKLRKERYALDSEALRKYFPVAKVVSGLFAILEGLYDISFERNDAKSRWHADVQVYDVRDKATRVSRGTLFLDLFKRKHKDAGAWMNPVQSKRVTSEGVAYPVTYIVCNAPKDKGQEPTFELEEVVTLFHEMGHALHNMLTEVTVEHFSGLANVQHDAVELPSQFMENFCQDFQILTGLTAHIDTGESLPQAEFTKLQAAKNFMAAGRLLGGARYSLIDMLIYANPGVDPLSVEKAVFDEWKVRELDPRSLLLPHFSHIFAGGYSAGYYAYQWAEMLSADAFAALKEQGETYLDQREAASRFRQHILAAGGYSDMAQNFRAFRGRDPELGFLLQDHGIS